MKKLFAIVAVMGVLTFGSTQLAQAQDAPAAEQTEQADPAVVTSAADEASCPAAVEAEGGIHKELKTKFIEGTAFHEFGCRCARYWTLLLYRTHYLSELGGNQH